MTARYFIINILLFLIIACLFLSACGAGSNSKNDDLSQTDRSIDSDLGDGKQEDSTGASEQREESALDRLLMLNESFIKHEAHMIMHDADVRLAEQLANGDYEKDEDTKTIYGESGNIKWAFVEQKLEISHTGFLDGRGKIVLQDMYMTGGSTEVIIIDGDSEPVYQFTNYMVDTWDRYISNMLTDVLDIAVMQASYFKLNDIFLEGLPIGTSSSWMLPEKSWGLNVYMVDSYYKLILDHEFARIVFGDEVFAEVIIIDNPMMDLVKIQEQLDFLIYLSALDRFYEED